MQLGSPNKLSALVLVFVILIPITPTVFAQIAGPTMYTPRLIVKFKEAPATAETVGSTVQSRVARLAAKSRPLTYVRPMALGAHVVALDFPVTVQEANEIAAQLATDLDVEYAQADGVVTPQFVPNDPYLLNQQYLQNPTPAYYAAIDAFGAWDITTGSANTVVAVVDTGYTPHAGMAGRFLPGYDFITDVFPANDGDGRDADASDPGDWVTQSDIFNAPQQRCFHATVGNSSWHGTKVASAIAANSNDGAYTAGIDWAAKILPVRVEGKCSGIDSDIIDGIAWAAGLSVPGVPINVHPAQVINLSFGAPSPCSPAYQAVMDAALSHGVTRAIVAAAGNSNIDVANFYPANCLGVISVGAITVAGVRAPYSDYGGTLTLSAPSGSNVSADGFILGFTQVLSNLGPTKPAGDYVTWASGTSMAAPMVSGVVALMLAVAPKLTAYQVKSMLIQTARKPFLPESNCNSPPSIGMPSINICGAGMLNAKGAVQAAQATVPTIPENYEGLWWNSPAGSEAGWGINFAHQGDTIFASWFTYDLNGKAWWLVMSADKIAAHTYSGTLFQGTGPSFDAVPFPPLGAAGGATGAAVGTGTLTFNDANNGTFAYMVNGVNQTKAITRETFGPLPVCVPSAQYDPSQPPNYQDLWWAAPAGSEAGWGINLTHEGITIFGTWYTYDHDRSPMWLVTTATRTVLGTYTGDLLRLTSGPPFNSVPFPPIGSPGSATGSAVGTATFSFTDTKTGTFAYSVNGVTQSKAITREVFAGTGTICQ